MSTFTVKQDEGYLFLEGNLDENADLQHLAKTPADGVKLNLRNLGSCNSIGIQALIRTVRGWGSINFEYHECPIDFLHQLEMIPDLLGVDRQGTVETMNLPYECENCDVEKKYLLDSKLVKSWADSGEDPPCRKCECEKGCNMELNEDIDFVFLKDAA